MPQVQEYQQQVEAQGAVGGTSPNIELAGAEGQAIERLGGTIEEAGQTIHRRQAQEETADVSAGLAEQRATWTEKLRGQIQDGTLDVDKFKDEYDKSISDMQDSISTPEGKRYFERINARTKGNLLSLATAGAGQVAAKNAAAKWQSTMGFNSSTLMRDPGSFHDVYEQGVEQIDQMIQTGGLPAKMRDTAIKQMGAEYAKGAIRGFIDQSPEAAKELIKQGAYDQFLDADQKHQMLNEVTQGMKASEVESRRSDKAQEDARKKQQEAWGADALPKLNNNTLTSKDVLSAVRDGTMDWEHGERWLNMIDQGAKKELKTNPRIKNALIQRIVDPNSPTPINSVDDLMPYVGKGISISDLNSMNSLFNKTPEGEALKQGEKALFQQARSTVRFKNPMTNQYDTMGEQKLAQFMNDYIQAKSEAKANNIKPSELLDPSNANYFAKDMTKYMTPLSEQLTHVADDRSNKALGLRPSPSNPEGKPADKKVRQKGETAQQYMDRINKGG